MRCGVDREYEMLKGDVKKEWRLRAARLILFRLMAIVGGPVLLFGMAEWIVRFSVDVPPSSFFVEEERDGMIWVQENPYYGYTFSHPQQAREPALNLFPKQKPPGTIRLLVLGESAAMGFPRPEFGLARFLTAQLRVRYPEQPVDVIDGTMTMINSHLVREIALEALAYEPDLVVVYAGNNEVIGPYGASGVFGPFYRSTRLVRAERWLRTRSALVRWLTAQWRYVRGDEERVWEGLDHYTDVPVPADDPRLDTMYDHFETNIRDIAGAASRRDIPVLLVTPFVNLRDWPPLYSFDPTALGHADRAAWEGFRTAVTTQMAEGRWSNALVNARQAAELAPDHAATVYDVARCLDALGRKEEAITQYEEACRLDGYRFRADRELADRIRQVAAGGADRGRVLVDARRELGVRAAESDDPLLLEHVHFTVRGMAELSARLAEEVSRSLPDVAAFAEERVDRQDVREALFYQPDIAEEAWSAVRQFLALSVFHRQSGYTRRLANAKRREEAAAAAAARVDRDQLASDYERARAYQAAPAWLVDALYGRYLMRRRAYERALPPLQAAVAAKPAYGRFHQMVGQALFRLDEIEAATAAFTRALDANPYLPESLNFLGLSWYLRGSRSNARRYYQQALAIDPRHAGALNNLGYIAYEEEAYQKAADLFRRALSRQPDLLQARYHLGLTRMALGQLEEAARQFEECVRRQPTFARAWNAWGLVEMRGARRDSAEEKFTRALSEEPALVEPRINLAYVYMARDAYQDALPELEQVVAQRPDDPEARYMYGKALAALGPIDEAVPHLRRAIQAAPHRIGWMVETAELIRQRAEGAPELLHSARDLAFQAWIFSKQSDQRAWSLLQQLDGLLTNAAPSAEPDATDLTAPPTGSLL